MRSDERLNRLIEDKKVKWERPKNALGDYEDYFNILVIHQNRYKGAIGVNRRNSITDETVPSWFNLVIWGHEHESIPTLVPCVQNGVEFLQPGSTVRTSLIETEKKPKHCFILNFEELHSEEGSVNYELQKFELMKVRPFIYREIILSHTKIAREDEARQIQFIQD